MNNKGFTLIELLVVVAIIGILAAIAIPQFADYKKRAFNARAESDLRNGLTSEEAYYVDNEKYLTCNFPTGGMGSPVCNSATLPGFIGSDGVRLSLLSQNNDSEFSAGACHDKGDVDYSWLSSGVDSIGNAAGSIYSAIRPSNSSCVGSAPNIN